MDVVCYGASGVDIVLNQGFVDEKLCYTLTSKAYAILVDRALLTFVWT
jgi:hypothetical protein